MTRPLALLLAALALVAIGIWMLGRGGETRLPGSARNDLARGAVPGGDERAAPIPAPRAVGVDRPPDPPDAGSDASTRSIVEVGVGTLRLEPVFNGMPTGSLPLSLGLVPENPDTSAAGLGRLDCPTSDGPLPPLALRAGSYRVFVVRGPGDAPDAQRSAQWTIDQFDDLVRVSADQSTRHQVHIVRPAEETPERGKAQVRGVAFIDGAPAAGCLLSSDPLGGSRSVRIAADGSFDLGETLAGLQRLQVAPPVGGVRRNQPLARIATIDIAPRVDEHLFVRIDARTATLEVVTTTPDGTPISARLRIRGIPNFVLPAFGAMDLVTERRTDESGHDLIDLLPPGSLSLDISTSQHAAPVLDVEIGEGESKVLRVSMAARIEVTGSLDLEAFDLKAGRVRATIFFDGPRSESIITRRDGTFRTTDLIPGRYEIAVLTGGIRRIPVPPLEIGPNGATDLRLAPVRGAPR